MKGYLLELLGSTVGALTIQEIFLNFIVAGVLGAVIFISYKLSHPGPVYSVSFNITLATLTLVTTLVMNVIGNNIALSLGMVGALSIVRFRTAIKDPRDATYIFWGIAVGICCGVQEYLIASIGSAFIFLLMLVFGAVKGNNRFLLIVRGNSGIDKSVRQTVDRIFNNQARLCVVNEADDSVELIYEISRKEVETANNQEGDLPTAALKLLEGVRTVSLVDQGDEAGQ
jgi:uncharacterized membrane protein YhiD involved in acid resistance